MRSGLIRRGAFLFVTGIYSRNFTQQKDDAMRSKHCTVHEV